MSTVDSAKPAKPGKGKVTNKTKKPTGKAKGKAAKGKQEEVQIASSFLEPEDDNFEVKVTPSPASGPRNKKRKSEDISMTNDGQSAAKAEIEDLRPQVPAKRQRRTRASSIVEQPLYKPISAPDEDVGVDARMTDAEEIPPSAPIPKKKGKGGKQRASSAVRKASNVSSASKASLRANFPDDKDIDAALEVELDLPLTDEEDETKPEQPKLNRSKPASKKTTASVARTRRGTRASSFNPTGSSIIAPNPTITQSVPVDEHDNTYERDASDAYMSEADNLPSKAKKRKGKREPRSPQPQEDQEINAVPPQMDESEIDREDIQASKEVVKSQPEREIQPARQLPTRNKGASDAAPSADAIAQASNINSSMLDTQTAQDDSGHETDASVIKKDRTGREGKKARAPVKKTKKGKKATTATQKVQNIAQEPVMKDPIDQYEAEMLSETVNFDEGVKPDKMLAESSKTHAKETEAPQAMKAKKGKASKAKNATKETANNAPPKQDEAVMESHDPPATLPPPSMHSTPRPALSTQSSDAENQPPSSRPVSTRPPLTIQSPSKSQITKIPLTVTPTMSPSKTSFSRLQSTFHWTAVDLETIFQGTPSTNKENDPSIFGNACGQLEGVLTSPEKRLTVEEWIRFNAQRGEERLRSECERLVGRFEGEGVRALRALEGIVCVP